VAPCRAFREKLMLKQRQRRHAAGRLLAVEPRQAVEQTRNRPAAPAVEIDAQNHVSIRPPVTCNLAVAVPQRRIPLHALGFKAVQVLPAMIAAIDNHMLVVGIAIRFEHGFGFVLAVVFDDHNAVVAKLLADLLEPAKRHRQYAGNVASHAANHDRPFFSHPATFGRRQVVELLPLRIDRVHVVRRVPIGSLGACRFVVGKRLGHIFRVLVYAVTLSEFVQLSCYIDFHDGICQRY
jgi:hypothetical protein